MTNDNKALKAAETLRRYCSERACNGTCIFYSKYSGVCKLKVKSPDCFPDIQKNLLKSSIET